MKKLLYVLTGIALITAGGCWTSSPTSPASGERGSVAFKLDKTTIPQGVVMVEAILSRSGYDSLATSVDVQTDTSASLQMSGIPVGQWHLTVNAMDGAGNIMYTGEADVDITAGATTQLELTLQPVSQGTGSISITVNWGTGGVHFVDYAGNPILVGNDSLPGGERVSQGKLIYENGVYKMWYQDVRNSQYQIWFDESSDGMQWNSSNIQTAFTAEDTAAWDYGYALAPSYVLNDGGTYKLYYNAMEPTSRRTSLGLAVSTDGVKWQRGSEPVFTGNFSSQYYIGPQTVIKVNGTYFMYFDAASSSDYEARTINLATSSDGVKWTNFSGNPILTATMPWQMGGISFPSVIYDNGQFVMVYMNETRQAFGIAYSSDGIRWIQGSGPIFSTTDTDQHWAQISYPFLLKANGQYRIYYSGVDANGNLSICFANSSIIE